MLQFKTLSESVKDVDTSGRTVTGYFSSFGNVDSDGDVIMPGAFERTIRERGPEGKNRIFHLFQHDAWRPLGKPSVLKEDDKGLYFETSFPDTTLANDTLKLYQAGIYNEHSIGYKILNSDPATRDGQDIQELKELMLWEGSTVTWGANEDTPATGIKSLIKDETELQDEIEKIQKFLRNGEVTDETFQQLEYKLEQLKLSMPSQEEEAEEEPSQDDLKDLTEPFQTLETKLQLNDQQLWNLPSN